MFRKNIYRWHRTLSLVIAIPVLLWALSGFMHPLMTNIRPKVTTQFLSAVAVDSSKIRMPLEQALYQNHIDSFATFRLVHIEDNWFYQVQQKPNSEPVYLATLNGKMLTAGNWLYAQYLAKQFLEGAKGMQASAPQKSKLTESSIHDCCDAATDCVINAPKGAKVSGTSFIKAYDDEYKGINRLLPVYRIAFNRPDGIRIYVETTTDRFAFAMDNKRYVFDRIFTLLHTWAWLDFLGKGKLVVEFLLAGLAFITTLMGIWIFFTTKSKKVPGNGTVKARRNHRYTAIVAALFTLMFSFSGAYHAFSKLNDNRHADIRANVFYRTDSVYFNLGVLQQLVKDSIVNMSLASIDGKTYWRVQVQSQKMHPAIQQPKDLMKATGVSMPAVTYISTSDQSILTNGEELYARFLAASFSAQPDHAIVSVEAVTKFGSEYNFADKRLPVWKINYASNGNERFFVETSTGSMAKRINDKELREDYSFAFLHKHEFLGWAGKEWKDRSTMFWAAMQVVMVVMGLVLYFRWRKRTNGKTK
jgi:hypothetical protein